MRSRWMTLGVAPALALGLSCSDGTGPDTGDLETFVLAFCASELPVFFAYQNEGEQWTRVQPNNNSFTFDASPRVGLAITYDYGNEFLTDVYYTTADEVRPLSGIACTETVGPRNVSGSVSNLSVGQAAQVTLSGASDEVIAPSTSYVLSGIANNPQTLVAHREDLGTSGATPNRVVIRRALDPLNNTVLPVIDFGTEGQAVATHTATITGLVAGETNTLDVFFETASGTSHTLYLSPEFTNSSRTLYGVPSALTQTGDVHRIELNADASASYRSVFHWTRLPGDKAFTLGAALTQPTVTKVASAPYARLRATLPPQPDYDDFITAFFIQGTQRSFFVTVTAAYVDGPITEWTAEMPDLTPAGSFPPGAGLSNSTSTEWFVEAYDGSLAALIAGTPQDGATVRYAGRSSAISTLQANMLGMGARAHAARQQLLRRAFTR